MHRKVRSAEGTTILRCYKRENHCMVDQKKLYISIVLKKYVSCAEKKEYILTLVSMQ